VHNNKFIQLPAPVSGPVGAAVDVSALGSDKTIIIGGTFSGSLTVEASADGGLTWGPAGGSSSVKTLQISLSADMMRLRCTGNPTVWVGAARTGSKKGVIPTTPGNGTGAPLDVSGFGGVKTLVSGSSFTGAASIEVSDDGIKWSPLESFTGIGVSTKTCYAKKIRCVRSGASGSTTVKISVVAANDVGEAGSIALIEPVDGLVYRPFDPAGVDYANVYVSWTNLMAAIAAQRTSGRTPIRLYFDARFSPDFDGIANSGRRCITIPNGTWDMSLVTWSGHPETDFFSGCSIIFDEGCHIENLQTINSLSDFCLVNKSSVNVPIVFAPIGKIVSIGGWMFVANNSNPDSVPYNPNAKPVFKIADGGNFCIVANNSTLACLGLHDLPPPSMSPLFDINGGGLIFTGLLFDANAIGNSQPDGLFLTNNSPNNDAGFVNSQNWVFTDPGMATTTVLVENFVRARYGMSIDFPVVTAAESPFAAQHGHCVNADTSGGQLDVTMPTAKISRGDKVFVKDESGAAATHPIVISALPGETIEGAATYSISVANGGVTMVSNGAGRWMIESKI
jgi:hypothetical protein